MKTRVLFGLLALLNLSPGAPMSAEQDLLRLHLDNLLGQLLDITIDI